MNTTAVVLNAGLGDLALGLRSAGFQIVAAYESEQAAMEIHRANIDVPVFLLQSEKFEPRIIPNADLLAARLYSPQLSAPHRMSPRNHCDIAARHFLELLHICCPKAFLLALNAASIKGRQIEPFLNEIARMNFRYSYQLADIAEITGMPTTERMVFVIGNRLDIHEDLYFPKLGQLTLMSLEAYLQSEDQIDPWYFNSLKPDQIPIERSKNRVYCWNKNRYVGTDRVRWNSWKIPLVNTGETFRKMTHREIANLKGFPADYDLSAVMAKSQLYKKLMYAVNVQAVIKLAEELAHMIGRPQWNPSIYKYKQFENLFDRYLLSLGIQKDRGSISLGENHVKHGYDFVLRLPDQLVYIELKYYRSRFIPSSRIKIFCMQLSARPEDGEILLVLASEVSEGFKQDCWEQFHVHIWDIKNLLWLFSEFEEIRSEFVALSDYATGDILPVPPEFLPYPNTLEDVPEASEEKLAAVETVSEPFIGIAYEEEGKEHTETASWKERLSRIDPGEDHSREYERFCVDFLKCILTDYFSLWEEQEQTNDGLHRFDLCCKIKNGVNQDFFNTISHHYNTKYVVFEFKNYSKEITQKEIYTTEKYLYKTALRQVAIIISRRGCDGHAMQAAKGSLRESGKLILCLSDQDLLKMADMWKSGDPEPAQLLSDKLDNLLIHLEK